LFREGLKWNIGDETRINACFDNWSRKPQSENTPPGLKCKKQKNKIGGLKYNKKYSKMNLLNATIPNLPSLNPRH